MSSCCGDRNLSSDSDKGADNVGMICCSNEKESENICNGNGVSVSVADEGRRHFTAKGALVPSKIAALDTSIINSRLLNQIPTEILEDPELQHAASLLPLNYNFEVYKSVWQIRKHGAKRVALQLPEGLQLFATLLAKIFERFCGCQMVILGDVTYGACCVDDYTARSLDCGFMIHYGHSCLVPVTKTFVKTLYVFVEIVIDVDHVEALIKKYLLLKDISEEETEGLGLDSVERIRKMTRIALVSTVQFISTVHVVKQRLSDLCTALNIQLYIPQSRPLSSGEVLGCTAPRLPSDVDGILYVGDGRFHLEAIMIANPHLQGSYFRYDPYSKRFSLEGYNHQEMHERRLAAIESARTAKKFGLILGTLGRQGSPAVLDDMRAKLDAHGRPYMTILMSEIKPAKLAKFKGIDVWVQVACPRLSIDWSGAFDRPILTPYELNVALGEVAWQAVYPMDFYAKESLGPWTPNHQPSSNKFKK